MQNFIPKKGIQKNIQVFNVEKTNMTSRENIYEINPNLLLDNQNIPKFKDQNLNSNRIKPVRVSHKIEIPKVLITKM